DTCLVALYWLRRVHECLGRRLFREPPASSGRSDRVEPLGRERPRVYGNRSHVRIARKISDAIEPETRVAIRVEQRDVDALVGIFLDVELDDLDAVAKRAQHRFETTQ